MDVETVGIADHAKRFVGSDWPVPTFHGFDCECDYHRYRINCLRERLKDAKTPMKRHRINMRISIHRAKLLALILANS
jgi:hypothetical protein